LFVSIIYQPSCRRRRRRATIDWYWSAASTNLDNHRRWPTNLRQ